jgi:non-heme chloroperoxidase
MPTAPSVASSVTEHEAADVERANATGRQPVVFVRGLWLLPNSWERWAALFDACGYTSLTPGWPDDPETVAEANAHPGGAPRSSATRSVACWRRSSPAAACRRRNPANRSRAIPLTYDQFRYAFANAVSEDEAHRLYDEFAVPASGVPLFQAATANLNPWTEIVEVANRGHALIIDGGWREVADTALSFVQRFV